MGIYNELLLHESRLIINQPKYMCIYIYNLEGKLGFETLRMRSLQLPMISKKKSTFRQAQRSWLVNASWHLDQPGGL